MITKHHSVHEITDLLAFFLGFHLGPTTSPSHKCSVFMCQWLMHTGVVGPLAVLATVTKV